MSAEKNLNQATENLLYHCAGLKPGDSFLIVTENPALGWYDDKIASAVLNIANELGLKAELIEVQGPETKLENQHTERIHCYDKVIYFSRIGDQNRFAPSSPAKTNVMCYTRDLQMLQSAFGHTNYGAMVALKNAVNEVLHSATHIQITCPFGTQINGQVDTDISASEDVSIKRFPLGVFKPVSAANFSGRVALSRYLTSTGSQVYQPATLTIDQPVIADVKAGRIIQFRGDTETVASIENHYQMVAEKFDIDSAVVHSWHAGIHPACSYSQNINENPDRWSNTVFNHPRCLHFHTCGNYPPGEICWMLLDHSVIVDDLPLWDRGQLIWRNFEQTNQCIQSRPELMALFDAPAAMIENAA